MTGYPVTLDESVMGAAQAIPQAHVALFVQVHLIAVLGLAVIARSDLKLLFVREKSCPIDPLRDPRVVCGSCH